MPIHILWGDDYSAIERETEKLIKQKISPEWLTLNLSRINGDDQNQINQAINDIRTPAFGISDRVIVIKNSPFCNNCGKEVGLLFEEAIDLIPHNTHLILQNSTKPDSRLRTTKTLKKLINKNIVTEKSFLLPAVWDHNGQKTLIERIAKEFNLKIDLDAILFLIDAIGNDSARIYSELEKISLHARTKQLDIDPITNNVKINIEIVNDLVDGITTNALEIGDYLLKEKTGEAIYRINTLIDKGEPALRILATLIGQIRGLLWVSLLQLEGENDVNVMAKAAGIGNPKRIYFMRKQVQGKSPKELLELLSCLLEIEASLKKGLFAKDAFKDGLINQKSFE